MSDLAIIILAAGQGTRMVSRLPKVLHRLAGRSLLRHVCDTVTDLEHDRVHVVYGHGGSVVPEAEADLPVCWVEQREQRGTGHAVALALEGIPEGHRVLVLYGDVPLIRTTTLYQFLLWCKDCDLGLLTFLAADPAGYGRVLRDDDDKIIAIIEERDADAAQRAIKEVNSGIVLARAGQLVDWLGQLACDNAQGEQYLTDCVARAVAEGGKVYGHVVAEPEELTGINDRAQLAVAERYYQRRMAEALMRSGTSLADPQRIDIHGEVRTGRDCYIAANVLFTGEVLLGDDVYIGPNCVISDSVLASGTVVCAHCVIEGAVIDRGSRVGPFARIRPHTFLAEDVQVGNFVEIKQSRVANGSKVNHLSYIGDSELGSDSNIGAGVITCNYDGANKHKTSIGHRVFVGANAQLIAPVHIGDGATIGAGTTITRNVAAGSLALSRAPQRSVANWRRPGLEPEEEPEQEPEEEKQEA